MLLQCFGNLSRRLTRKKCFLILTVMSILFVIVFVQLKSMIWGRVYATKMDTVQVRKAEIKENSPASHNKVTDVRFPLQTPGDEENKGNSSTRTPGYGKGSRFVQSIGNSHAVCVGSDTTKGEVEDLLCKPRPHYDSRMKNPCWWEKNSTATTVQLHPRPAANSLRCLPYFHILCCSKAGTTDLFYRLALHPDIVSNTGTLGKESMWWSYRKYGYQSRSHRSGAAPFDKYVKGFSPLASRLEKASQVADTRQLEHLVTLDGSPLDMYEFRGWPQLPQNRGLQYAKVTTPHLMYHLYRDPKFIVLMRNPVERLYTAFLFGGIGNTREQFHRYALEGTALVDRCLNRTHGDRNQCFYSSSAYHDKAIDVRFNCFAVHVKEWFQVFPKKHFLFLRTEDYSSDMKGSLTRVFDFLDLPKPSDVIMDRMSSTARRHHTAKKDRAGSMLQKTRDHLEAWYQPWNQELAQLLGDRRFLWEKEQ